MLYQALHACRAEAFKNEHARPSISDGALRVALLLAIANLAFIARQIDVRLTIPRRCFTNLICLLPKPVRGERPIVLQSFVHGL